MGREITFDPGALGVDVSAARLVISNGDEKEGSGVSGVMRLGRWEGRVYLL
jgi:hypothetical protein